MEVEAEVKEAVQESEAVGVVVSEEGAPEDPEKSGTVDAEVSEEEAKEEQEKSERIQEYDRRRALINDENKVRVKSIHRMPVEQMNEDVCEDLYGTEWRENVESQQGSVEPLRTEFCSSLDAAADAQPILAGTKIRVSFDFLPGGYRITLHEGRALTEASRCLEYKKCSTKKQASEAMVRFCLIGRSEVERYEAIEAVREEIWPGSVVVGVLKKKKSEEGMKTDV